MPKRSPEYIDEFHFHLADLDETVKSLVLDGSIEICPSCGELSAYCYDDTTAYDDESENQNRPFWTPKKGTIALISTSCGLGSWTCGHCNTPWMERNSPLNSSCFTHDDD